MRVFLSLLLVLLVGLLLVIGGGAAVAQDVTPGVPTVIATATVPIFVVTPATGCYEPLPLIVGGEVLLRGGVNVRSQPNLSGALVNYFDEQVRLTLVDGPVCANGYNWWRVSGIREPGWVVEGTPGRYFLQAFEAPVELCYPPTEGVRAGGQLRTLFNIRLRTDPAPNARVITVIPFDTTLPVIDGPFCADGEIYWYVRAPFQTSGVPVEGWIQEGFPDERYIAAVDVSGEIVIPCPTPLRLTAGTVAAVTYRDGVQRRLRAAPDAEGRLLITLLDGVAFEVIDGISVCADGYNWWRVRILTTGLEGWIAEGRPGNYWFEILY